MKTKKIFEYKNIEFLWEPRDLWIGLYWDKRNFAFFDKESENDGYFEEEELHLYFCLIPTFVLHFQKVIK